MCDFATEFCDKHFRCVKTLAAIHLNELVTKIQEASTRTSRLGEKQNMHEYDNRS